MKYLYDPPYLVKKIFRNFQWESITNKILLTFDDGPTRETTEGIIKLLNELKIKSVFFCVGNNIFRYPSLCDDLIKEGHTIANHTCSHQILTKSTIDTSLKEINSFNALLEEKHNYNVKYFRPPHGKFNFAMSKLIKELGIINIMWSLLTYDYKNDINLVKFVVKNYLKDNSIVVLHDSLKSKGIIYDSIKYIVEEANNKGYYIGEPAECLKQSF